MPLAEPAGAGAEQRQLKALLLLLLLAVGQSREDVDRAFAPLVQQYEVPGLIVGVTRNGRQSFFTYGPVTQDTLFEIGSVSKTFTATLIVRSQIPLDAHPGQFWPELKSTAIDRTTVLQLATYTAGGLPLQFPETASDLVTYFRDWKPLAPLGTVRRYSNPSIGLAGYLAARAMQGDFVELMETRIFPSLGLRHTFIRVPEGEMQNYTWGHDKDGKPIRVNPGLLDAEAYGVKSTAADLLRFVEWQFTPNPTQVGYFQVGPMVQCLGWEQYRYPVSLATLLEGNSARMALENNPATPVTKQLEGEVLFNKTGSTNGFGAYVVFVPARRIGLVMLANKSFPNAERVKAALAVLERL